MRGFETAVAASRWSFHLHFLGERIMNKIAHAVEWSPTQTGRMYAGGPVLICFHHHHHPFPLFSVPFLMAQHCTLQVCHITAAFPPQTDLFLLLWFRGAGFSFRLGNLLPSACLQASEGSEKLFSPAATKGRPFTEKEDVLLHFVVEIVFHLMVAGREMKLRDAPSISRSTVLPLEQGCQLSVGK